VVHIVCAVKGWSRSKGHYWRTELALRHVFLLRFYKFYLRKSFTADGVLEANDIVSQLKKV